MKQDVFALTRGTAPLLVSIPHAGTLIPHALERRLTPAALQRADVDWHLPRLYEFVHAMGATLIAANYARHVIDLNRPPQDESLYPGQDVTGLLPMDTFRKEPLYLPGEAPDAAECDERRERFWRPYHEALRAELERRAAPHGVGADALLAPATSWQVLARMLNNLRAIHARRGRADLLDPVLERLRILQRAGER